MIRRSISFVVVLSVLTTASPGFACLWDYDTLQMERTQFPNSLELITGKFLRHSPEFYRWRIADRKKRLESEPDNLALYDDLAVAYEKIGNHKKANETILLKEKKKPGLYETYANLGTFYIHAGQYRKGLQEIERAISINPRAHFGREVYQKLLVEYVLLAMKDGKLQLPLSKHVKHERSKNEYGGTSFAKFVLALRNTPHSHRKPHEEIDAAIKGILGMMRFGHHDSPVLLEALGDLLSSDYRQKGAKRLAARAYLKASYAAMSGLSGDYREFAVRTIKLQTVNSLNQEPLTIQQLEERFRNEQQEADEWYEQIRKDELAWIAAGVNVDAEFSKKYYVDPEISPDYSDGILSRGDAAWLIAGGILLTIIAAFVFFRIRRNRLRAVVE